MNKRTRPGLPVPHLQEWREWAVLDQLSLAREADLDPTTIWKIERGDAARFSTIRRLAEALKISPQQLMYELPPERIEASAS